MLQIPLNPLVNNVKYALDFFRNLAHTHHPRTLDPSLRWDDSTSVVDVLSKSNLSNIFD